MVEKLKDDSPGQTATTTMRSDAEEAKREESGGAAVIAAAAADAEPPSEAPLPDDSQPLYSIFTAWEKRAIVLGAVAGAFFSPLTAQIYMPALNVIADEFGVSISQINLTVTTYMIFQGIIPMFIGSFADAMGRRPAYLMCFVIYIGANIGCALAPNYPALLVLRMLQSAGSAPTVALCQATVSDTITSAERGQYVSYTSLPILLAPALGPVLGGILTQYLGWRWIFWLLTILAGFVLVMYIFFFPETCRALVGDGSIRPHKAYQTLWQVLKDRKAARAQKKSREQQGDDDGGEITATVSVQQRQLQELEKKKLQTKKFNVFRSIEILFEVEMALLLGYNGIMMAGFYSLLTTIPSLIGPQYGLNDLEVGLIYLPLAAGCMVAASVIGRLMNWNFRRHCALKNVPFVPGKQQDLSEFPIERARLEVGAPMLVLAAASLMTWGWAVQYNAQLAAPCVILFVAGFSLISFSNSSSVLIVDMEPKNAGAATASNNVVRCLIGAAASAVIEPMIQGVGVGWAFMILGALFFVFAPSLWLIMRNGIQWRKEKAERRRKRQARKDEKERKKAEKRGGVQQQESAKADDRS